VVRYRNTTTPASLPGTLVPVASVTPLDTGPFGATTFFVNFVTPQSGTGTYSYSVGPNISDRIRSPSSGGLTINQNATARQVNLRIPPVGTGGSGIPSQDQTNSTIAVSGVAVGLTVTDVNVNLTLTHTFDSDLQISLIGPDGTTVVLSQNEGGGGHNFTNTT